MHDIDRSQLEGEEELALEAEAVALGAREGLGEAGGLHESPLGELQEIELAAELLEVSSEGELEQFLGNLIRRVGSAAGAFVRSDTGRALGGILKNAARQALPVLGRGIGQWVAPGVGGALGARTGRLAGQMLGLELEGLSHEDREFEVARAVVRLSAAAARNAARAPGGPAQLVARRAAAAAARRYAPGLVPRLPGRSSLLWPRTGRWIRRGRTIVLLGG